MNAQINIYSVNSPYYMFTANMIAMFILQLLYIIIVIIKQCNADLFFIDWEPAKNRADVKGASHSISVWRSILVANEWAEMQTMRKTDIKFTLFFLALILIGSPNLQFAATTQPVLSDLTPGGTNIILRFTVSTFFWLLLSMGQYSWKYFIYERFFAEPPDQLFVDFCTIAKVSVFVLDEKYHGYYLHCRSPHQYADGSMAELVEMLHKEEAGLTTDRSLDGAPPDVQTFQMFLSVEFRAEFDKIYNSLVGPTAMTETFNNYRTKGAQSKANPWGQHRELKLGQINYVPTERVMKAWKELTTFLQEFIENNFGKTSLRREVREPTYLEKLLGGGPNLSIPEQASVFLTDRDYNYSCVMFLGRELDLLLLNILVYSVFDMLIDSVGVSILLCYIFEFCICYIRQIWGQIVISRKTLIDGRFLI